jgi:hypothetical protein
MSNTSISSWIHAAFQELGVMILALVLAGLPFAATAHPVPAASAPSQSVVESAGVSSSHAG